MIKPSEGTINFNKELLFGEIGAITGAQIFGYVFSFITSSAQIISFLVVVGAIIGGAIFFLSLRTYHKSKKGSLSKIKFAVDLLYFTPAAFIITLVVYYPSLFFLSQYFLNHRYHIIFSTFISQIIAFVLFLIAVNIYRYVLLKTIKKEL